MCAGSTLNKALCMIVPFSRRWHSHFNLIGPAADLKRKHICVVCLCFKCPEGRTELQSRTESINLYLDEVMTHSAMNTMSCEFVDLALLHVIFIIIIDLFSY